MVRDYPYNLDETPYQLVRDWMVKFQRGVDQEFNYTDVHLCFRLIDEEFDEVHSEFFPEDRGGERYTEDLEKHIDREKLTKELCDLIWVCYFTGAKFGLPMEEAFKRVYQSNMSKLDDNGQPILREDGKILKSDNYKPAELGDLFAT